MPEMATAQDSNGQSIPESQADEDDEQSACKSPTHASENSSLLKPQPDDSDLVSELPSPARQRLMLAVLLLIQFLALSIDTFIVPFFPEIAKHKGLNNIHMGIIFSGYEFVRFISSPFYGSMVTTRNAKTLCVLGSFIVGLSCLLFGFAHMASEAWFFTLCLTLRLIAGNGSAMLTISSTSILMKSTSYTTNTIMGLVEMMIGAGYSFGPGIGALLYKYSGPLSGCWLFGSVALMGCVSMIWIVPTLNMERISNIEETENSQNFFSLLKIPGVLLMFISLAVLRFGAEANRTVIADFLVVQFHVDMSTVGLMFLSWSIGYIVFCPIVSRLVDMGYVYSIVIAAWSSKMMIFFLLAPSPLLNFIFHGKKYMMLPAVLMPISNAVQTGAYIPPFQASLDHAVLRGYDKHSIHTYAILNGMVNAGISLGSCSGPIFGGVIREHFSYDILTTILGFVFLTMLLLIISYLLTMKLLNKPIKPPAEHNSDKLKNLNPKKVPQFGKDEELHPH